MKINFKQLGSTTIMLLVLFVASFCAFDILVTWNSGIDKDYPGYTFALISCLSISIVYLTWYFRKVAV